MSDDLTPTPSTLLDAAVSARQETITMRNDAEAAWKRATRDAEEIEHYRDVLTTIEKATKGEAVRLKEMALLLELVHSLAHRALQYTGPRRRTWRDRWQAWWMTRGATP